MIDALLDLPPEAGLALALTLLAVYTWFRTDVRHSASGRAGIGRRERRPTTLTTTPGLVPPRRSAKMSYATTPGGMSRRGLLTVLERLTFGGIMGTAKMGKPNLNAPVSYEGVEPWTPR